MSELLERARQRMIAEHLRARGIADERVLAAMEAVPRPLFVAEGDATAAYDDRALPIDCGQTISQPYIVALMTQALDLSPGMRVLELGTGSGYQTAILAELGTEVFTVERHTRLLEQARRRLSQSNRSTSGNIHFRVGAGQNGWPEHAPFDRVIITAAAREMPPAVWEQLAEGGTAVAPFGPHDEQTLWQIRKLGGSPISQFLVACRFVPLI